METLSIPQRTPLHQIMVHLPSRCQGCQPSDIRRDSRPMTKVELVKVALTQFGVLTSTAVLRSSSTASAAITWHSPRFGLRSGRLLMDPGDGWVLAQGEHAPDLWVWVREELLDA